MRLRQHFLNHSRQCLVDREVINACQIVVDGDLLIAVTAAEAVLREEAPHVLSDFVERVKLLLILQKHIRIDLMDEHLECDGGVDLVGHSDDFEELVAAHVFVLLLRINHVDQRSTILERLLVHVLPQLLRSWIVLDLELDVRVVADV